MITLNDGSQLKMSRRHREQLEKVSALTCASDGHLMKYAGAHEQAGTAPANSRGGRGPSLT
jgi:hypothetical protein